MKKDDSVEEHIAKFKSLVSESRIDAASPVIIDMFRETLTIPVQRRILTLEKPPTTLPEWYDWAIKIDHNWRRMQMIVGRTQNSQQKGKNQRKFYFPRREQRDPNAMDIDRLSIEEREKLMKEGRCFRCKETGHRANECPSKGKTKEEPKKRMNRKELHTHVRSLFKDMTEEEKEEFMKAAEDAGF